MKTHSLRFLGFLALFILSPYFVLGNLSQQNSLSVDLVLSSNIDDVVPQSKFHCSGQIIAYATFPKEYIGSHQIEGIWSRPDGFIQEHTKLDLTFKPVEAQTAFLWIQFEGQTSLDVFRESENTTAIKNEYHGDWTFELIADGTDITQKKFAVQCP